MHEGNRITQLAQIALPSQLPFLFPYIVNLLVRGYDTRPRLVFLDLDEMLRGGVRGRYGVELRVPLRGYVVERLAPGTNTFFSFRR
jgi:hypothetical protein